MTRLIGHSTLIAAVLASATAVIASLSGRGNRMETGRRALTAAAVCLGGALVALAWALLTGDYSLEYVARATNRSMSWPYRLGSLWSGMEGSLLLWSWLLAVGSAVGVTRLRALDSTGLRNRAQAVCGVLVAAASLLVLTIADPFAGLAFPALDGAGLTPILEHPALLYHPPILYLGQTLLAVPFAITVAALLQGRLDTDWVAVARRFALVAWLALTAGIVAGAHWAYQELGLQTSDVPIAARLLGERVILTEVFSYNHLAQLISSGQITSPRTVVILSYALCGFAHVAAMAIFVGGTAALAPSRRDDLASLGLRALLAATLATLMTGCVAGIFSGGEGVLLVTP
jgi:hypothetical protein